MKKKLLVISLLCNLYTAVFAETIAIVPFVVYDHSYSKINMSDKPEKEVYKELESCWFEGLITFELLKSEEFGEVYTVLDANKLCEAGNKDYLLYGYIQKNENSWSANLKLYSRDNKKIVKEFFAGDEKEEYDRFINTLSQNVITGIGDVMGLREVQKKAEETKAVELNLPCSFYYWSPINGNWQDVLTGIAGTDCAIEFYPHQKYKVFHEYLTDYSFQFKLSYSFGLGTPSAYELDYHSIRVSVPVISHIHINSLYTVFLGGGIYYEFEMMNAAKKYEDKKFFYQNMGGLELVTGLEYKINDFISLKPEIDFIFQFNVEGFATVKPGLGVNFNLYRGK